MANPKPPTEVPSGRKRGAQRREIEGKLESGYAFCHPEDDCEGHRAAFAAIERAERAEAALKGYREAVVELAHDFEIGGQAEREADEPGVPSSVYYDCAEKLHAALLPGGDGEQVDRCPTCLSSNPWFTSCKDIAAAEAETGREINQRHRFGCTDPWHAQRIAESRTNSDQVEQCDGSGSQMLRDIKAVCPDCNRVWLDPSWKECRGCGAPNALRLFLWEAEQFTAAEEPHEVAELGEYVSVELLPAVLRHGEFRKAQGEGATLRGLLAWLGRNVDSCERRQDGGSASDKERVRACGETYDYVSQRVRHLLQCQPGGGEESGVGAGKASSDVEAASDVGGAPSADPAPDPKGGDATAQSGTRRDRTPSTVVAEPGADHHGSGPEISEAMIDQVLERFKPTTAHFDMGDGHTQEVDWRSIVGNVLYYAQQADPQPRYTLEEIEAAITGAAAMRAAQEAMPYVVPGERTWQELPWARVIRAAYAAAFPQSTQKGADDA